MKVFLVVKSFVPSHLKQKFDDWYEKEHLSEAKNTFYAISASRGWVMEKEDMHYAYYQFDNLKEANKILKGEALRKMIKIFDKKWSDQVYKTRKIISITQEVEFWHQFCLLWLGVIYVKKIFRN